MAKVLITLIRWYFLCFLFSVFLDTKQVSTTAWEAVTAICSLCHMTCSSETTNGGLSLSRSGWNLFCIEEKREEEAEKTPSTCSTNQGNQHFSHLDYCDTRINKCLGHLHMLIKPPAYRQNVLDCSTKDFVVKESNLQSIITSIIRQKQSIKDYFHQ